MFPPSLLFRLIPSPPHCNGRDRFLPSLAILTSLESLLGSAPQEQLAKPSAFTTGETDVKSASLGIE